jgi:hypothetical protein
MEGFWILDSRFWILDFGYLILDSGFWILKYFYETRNMIFELVCQHAL